MREGAVPVLFMTSVPLKTFLSRIKRFTYISMYATARLIATMATFLASALNIS